MEIQDENVYSVPYLEGRSKRESGSEGSALRLVNKDSEVQEF